MNLFDNTINTLTNSLDYASAKNRTIASNIANVDTPHYKAKKAEFKHVLNDSMTHSIKNTKTHDRHIDFEKGIHKNYYISNQHNTVYNHNGNNVDIDKEMSGLAENQIYYQALVDRLNGKFSNIQTVLRGGN